MFGGKYYCELLEIAKNRIKWAEEERRKLWTETVDYIVLIRIK